MSNTRTIRIVGDRQRDYAVQQVREAPQGYVVTIAEETRTQEQNRLMWPLIADMRAQIADMQMHSAEDIKLRFLNALGQEMRFLPELEGGGMFPVGQRSSTLTKKQFSALIEIMFHHGAKNGVRWSAKSQQTIDDKAMSLAA